MKLRFLALAGPCEARTAWVRLAAAEFPPGLARSHASHRFELWTFPETPVVHSRAGDSILIGWAFDRVTGRRIDQAPSAKLRPEAILRDLIGGYALISEREAGHAILRDPSGAIVVYHRPEGACDVYASDGELLWPGTSQALSPDLEYIRHGLSYPYLRAARTGCLGARELLPGQCRTVDGDDTVEQAAWHPTGHGAAVTRFDEAAGCLREELLRSIPRMVPQHEPIVLKLSGGLDSSLVAGVMVRAGLPFATINFATGDAEGDEREYARAVADACGIELHELSTQTDALDLSLARVTLLRPPRHPLLQALDRTYAKRFAALGTAVIVDGAGGDNVFAYLNTAAPALDAWRCGGLAAVARAIGDLGDVHGGNLWNTAGFAWRKLRRGTSTRWPAVHDFLMLGAIVAQPEPHPWLDVPQDVLPGMREHLRMIVGVRQFLPDPSPCMPAMVHPLLAQPIVELCLRIPTHLWIHGGRDRAVARAAATGLVPESNLARRGKGALGTMFRTQFRALAPQLGPFLCEGRLAEADIVDPAAITSYLEDPNRWAGYQAMRLLEIAAAEQWLRGFA
ncbi:MAG TPA: asparagine synthase-related protein [Reyranella sp.]|nr:asparagine synthase-related protein [Reyranella sp.]